MESYQRLIDVIALENLRMRAEFWVLSEVLVWSTLWQIGAVLASFGLAVLGTHVLRPWMRRRAASLQTSHPVWRGLTFGGFSVVYPSLVLLIVLAAIAVASTAGWPTLLLLTSANLLVAWIVIRLLSRLIRNDFWSRVTAFLIFAIATLNIVGLLEATIVWLDQIGIRLGSIHLSVLDVLTGSVKLAVLLWIALVVSRLLEVQVQNAQGLTPSLRVLTGKLLRFGLITLALVVALTSAGIDLTAFALFSGALGVGIGFGMQKSISNLISGLLLLFDRSIKPGDVLELSDPSNRDVQLFGWVTALNARYVSLTTRDGTEWLVPNEELISQRIVNWSYNHDRLRLLTPIGICFESDVRLAMQLAEDGARSNPRVLSDPAPVCRLMGFSDSTVNLEMRFWIDDPTNGIINVRSDVLVAIWDRFREHGIRTPFGHRDLHVKDDSELTVVLKHPS
ncbi:mechanosensitive ion channel family protein [Tropicimonas marinistellae]|uniref:mechanosensitive ion channel family protein n=1 Tax=Tropicimonas marinistellae TaxID=1739787 RepID=UPI00082C7A2F|nr:mechanosensitive ion channel domain-containing protein [Tropicimonas marinistellae]